MKAPNNFKDLRSKTTPSTGCIVSTWWAGGCLDFTGLGLLIDIYRVSIHLVSYRVTQ